ncbi:MAG: esterase/lipase family protein [Gammaproteobacteria bacterium]
MTGVLVKARRPQCMLAGEMAFQNPVVVVPGITASSMRDEYDVNPRTVWAALLRRYEEIALHPDDLRYERAEPARVVADHMFGIPYNELVKELRYNLTQREDKPTPVYPFAYDWRMPLDEAEQRLAGFVDEVIGRTKIMPHYERAGFARAPRVDLVGHSMGGVIVAGYLERAGRRAPVGKVVTLGAPFRGSPEAPVKIATGQSALGPQPDSSREREVARLTPALYHLLPSFAGAVEPEEGLRGTLYDLALWQPSILQTIAESIRLWGLRKTDRRTQAEALLSRMLSTARAHRKRLESFRLGQARLRQDDWLAIVGVGEPTRVRLPIRLAGGQPEFVIRDADRVDQWRDAKPAQRVFTGDGTVPYLGARSAFVPVEKQVCVSADDFGYFEIADRILEAGAGFHGLLPKMNLVHRLIVSHFTGKLVRGTWGRKPPDLPRGKAWKPPIEGLPAEA